MRLADTLDEFDRLRIEERIAKYGRPPVETDDGLNCCRGLRTVAAVLLFALCLLILVRLSFG